MNGSDSGASWSSEADRLAMVRQQIEARGVRDPRVLAVLREVPRHAFVPEALREQAYEDRPLPIGFGQTISQPYVVAFMTEQLRLTGTERVLEIGTGSGYQAAVLAKLAGEVFTIELIPELAERAAAALAGQSLDNVHVRAGDGYLGWPEHAPFDAIMVTAAPDHVPPPLLEQLAPGGRMVLPVGRGAQDLVAISKDESGNLHREVLIGVRFVPLRRSGDAD